MVILKGHYSLHLVNLAVYHQLFHLSTIYSPPFSYSVLIETSLYINFLPFAANLIASPHVQVTHPSLPHPHCHSTANLSTCTLPSTLE